jgi:hypothetical protein
MKTFFLLMTLMLAHSAFAELPSLIPRNVLFGNPDKASPRLSPDGKKLAYLAPEKDVLNVWVRTVGQQDDQVVTADKKRGIRIFFWQQDGEHILYCGCEVSACVVLLPGRILLSIDLAPMPNGEQPKNSLRQVEVVNHPVISNADSKSIDALHAHVWEPVERLAQSINLCLDSGLHVGRQFEEIGVEVPRVDLKRGVHRPIPGWRVRE